MVARIIKGNSLSKTLNYNEHKVQQGVAECIHSANYAKDTEQLNFFDKLRRLEHQAALNENVKANSVHISLNFDGADQLDKPKLTAIADTYMQQIGFGHQPYLVYQHKDAVLKQYNVMADRGKEGSRIHSNSGLVYRVLDANGNKIGVPIKASAFYNKPSLKTLEPLYAKNEVLRQCYKIRVKNSIWPGIKETGINTRF